jgi:HD-GYP domain-containing protein (c-di-GMP phosphodiesterase class II)
MAKVLEAKDPYTRFHSEKVSQLSSAVAREMGFNDEETRRIGIAGILHDLGKIGINESILMKPGPLDPKEREIVQRHPVIASTILEPIEQLQGALGYIKHHHEHFDGSGYPEKLSGEEIPLGARIIHATEAYDAMISRRSYSVPRSSDEAMKELRSCVGSQFDPHVVEALSRTLGRSIRALTEEHGRAGRSLAELLKDLTGRVAIDDSNPQDSGMRPAT